MASRLAFVLSFSPGTVEGKREGRGKTPGARCGFPRPSCIAFEFPFKAIAQWMTDLTLTLDSPRKHGRRRDKGSEDRGMANALNPARISPPCGVGDPGRA